MTPILLYLLPYVLIIYLCVRGIMWGASLLVLLQAAFFCLAIGMIMLFALPKQALLIGPSIPYLPISGSAIITLSAVLSIVFGQKNTNTGSGEHNKIGIVVFAIGIVLLSGGIFAFLLFLFGEMPAAPDPEAAVIIFSTTTLTGIVSIVLASRYESIRYPNIYRWLSFWVASFMLTAIFAFSMIFIFSYPSQQPTAHLFWASINSLNYIPVALLFVVLNKNYVKRKKADKTSPAEAEKEEFVFE